MPIQVLVIDDDTDSARQPWFKEIFQEMPEYKLTCASTPTEAFEHLAAHRFEVVFFDHDLGIEPNGSRIAYHVLMHPEQYHAPASVIVHSGNPEGKKNIYAKFHSAGVPCAVVDFEELKRLTLEQFKKSLEFSNGSQP